MAGYDWCFDSLILQDSSEVVSGLEVTSDYFEVIGVQPRFGRTFLNSEIAKNPESAAFIILGYELWQKYFHGNPNILGQKVQLSRHPPLTVVGVMPPSLRFLPSFGEESCPTYDVNARVDYWLPVEPDLSLPRGGSGNGPWSVVGRLRPGVTRAQAQAELAAISAKQAQANSYYKGLTIKVQPLTEFLNRDCRRLLLPLLAAVALVFLIACGNIAALLLARGLSRQQEYAVRCALGAGRVRLFRQVLVEALLLALLGSFFGLTLAIAIVRVFKAIGGLAIPRLDAVTVGWPMLAFCFATAVVAAFLAGFVPALRASRLDATQAAKTFGPTSSLARKERFLLGGVTTLQTSMTMALLVGACLLIQTVVNLANLRPGYETQNILTMSVMKEYRRGMNNDFHRPGAATYFSASGSQERRLYRRIAAYRQPMDRRRSDNCGQTAGTVPRGNAANRRVLCYRKILRCHGNEDRSRTKFSGERHRQVIGRTAGCRDHQPSDGPAVFSE